MNQITLIRIFHCLCDISAKTILSIDLSYLKILTQANSAKDTFNIVLTVPIICLC